MWQTSYADINAIIVANPKITVTTIITAIFGHNNGIRNQK
jgi:hypothetical protein